MRNHRALGWLLLPIMTACALLGRPNFMPPWRQDHIKFPHARHAKADVECLACHETVYDAEDLQARHLPGEDKCLECHAEEKEQGRCIFCHTDVQAAQPREASLPSLEFSHVKHLERTEEDCARCHTALSEPKRGGETVAMDRCLGCHEHKVTFREGRCDQCHTDLVKERVQPLREFTHQGNFVLQHRFSARASSESCMLCHTQNQCVDCHNATPPVRVELRRPEAVTSNFIHRNDFISRHNIEAQADPAQCFRCHGNSFCNDCHRMQNLTSTGSNPRNPHPRGWVMGGTELHGAAARRDIQQCASCHDQGPQSNCIQCHQVGGVGGNPHPPGWNLDHNRNDIQLNGMCQYCHLR
ncbi:MAG: cytochrome c3 family protein [Myxococcota bacterium]